MKFKTCLLSLFILILNFTSFGQDTTIITDYGQRYSESTYLVDFHEKGFLLVAEGEVRHIKYFDNDLNQKWAVTFEKGALKKDFLKFRITKSGNTIYAITNGMDNSNYVTSINSFGAVTKPVKVKYSVHGVFCIDENLVVEVYKVNNASMDYHDGYSRANEKLKYLICTPELIIEDFKLKVPVIKYKGESKYPHKWVVGATSESFYLGQMLQITKGTEYVNILRLNYDGTSKGLRIPFNVRSDYIDKEPSKLGHAYRVRSNTVKMLTYRSFYIDGDKKRILITRHLGNSVNVSTHNWNGGLLGVSTIELEGMPTKYKNWNVRSNFVTRETFRLDLLFLNKQDSFELFSYALDVNGGTVIEKRIGFTWVDPKNICDSTIPKQFDIFTLSEFGALAYFRELFSISGDDYKNSLQNFRYLKRDNREILFILENDKITISLFSEK